MIQLIMPIARAESLPGLTGIHWSAIVAVELKRGSM